MQKATPEKGSVREVLSIALPMLVSLSFDSLMTFIDRLFLAKLGSEYMNASLAGGLASFVLSTFFVGTIGYATAMVAQSLGANAPERGSRIIVHAVVLSLLAYPLLLLLRPLGHMLFRWTDVDPVQLVPQIQYYDILVWGAIIPLLRHALGCFFSGIGETRIVMVASFVGLLTNSGLNYALIFGHFGFPALGIQGAAIGTLMGGVASLSILAIRFFSKEIRGRFFSSHTWKLSRSIFSEFLRKGSPSGIELLLNLLAFQLMILIFHGRGLVNATAATIMFNWDMVTFIPLIGLEIASTSLVGRYAGAKDYESAERTTRSGIKIGWVFSFGIMLAFFIVPEWLVNVFRPDPVDQTFLDSFPIAVTMIRIASAYIMIEAIMVVYAGALRGAGDTFWTMVILVGLHWLIVATLWACYHLFQLGPIASWVVLVVGFMLFPVLLWLRWRTGKWKSALSFPH